MTLQKLSTLKNKTKKYTYVFSGINRSESFSAGQLEESENVSFDSFPAISAGRERTAPALSFDSSYDYLPAGGGVVAVKYTSVTGLTLGWMEESEGSSLKGVTTIADAAEGKRYAARLGRYVVVFPDKLYLDTKYTSLGFTEMEKTVELDDQKAYATSSTICFKNKSDYTAFSSAFKTGDVITFSGAWYYEGSLNGWWRNVTLIVREKDSTNYVITFDPNCFELPATTCEMADATFKKTVPELSNLTVYGGRVWGNDSDGKIYASKYSDPTNYEYFDLTSADSYTLETDTPGDFTASFAFGDHVAFFKEDKIHRITGTKPANYRHTVIATNGVKSGAERTMALKDDLLYYMGTDGIYVYGGSHTKKLSEPLELSGLTGGAAVFYKDTYYVCIKSTKGTELYGYDTDRGLWLKEGDGEFACAFKFLGESLYADESGTVMKLGDGKDTSRDISVTFREFTESDSEQKGWSRLYICARLAKGDRLKAETDYGFGFEAAGVFTDYRKTVFEVRLKPNRGDKIRLRLTASPDTVITKVMREHYVHGTVF